jgi:carbamoyltransferase
MEKRTGWTVAVHGGAHNSAVAVAFEGKLVEITELERVIKIKDAHFNAHGYQSVRAVRDYLWRTYHIDRADELLYTTMELPFVYHKSNGSRDEAPVIQHLKDMFRANAVAEGFWHHRSHAANAFFQSPFHEALVVSVDGFGNDGCFNLYIMDRKGSVKHLRSLDYSLGTAYAYLGWMFPSMRTRNKVVAHGPSSLGFEDNSLAGKIMGMAGYGRPDPVLVKRMKDHLKREYFGNREPVEHAKLLNLQLVGDTKKFPKELEGVYAASWQAAFEQALIEGIEPWVLRYPHLPLVMAGGCALNILANATIEQRYGREVFVPPNPDDRGLACGMILAHHTPQEPVDVTYLGIGIQGAIPSGGTRITPRRVAWDMVSGNIYGVMRGRSEVGPRALGNRSIICYPGSADMKATINAKVKDREWYRPFAPVVRLEDAGKFFKRSKESRWMSFATEVLPEYRDKIPAVVHADGTARVQTVTREQNSFIYDVLTEIDRLTGIGMLLNTSFNVDKQPILAYTDQAFEVLNNTAIDGIIIQDLLWRKQ